MKQNIKLLIFMVMNVFSVSSSMIHAQEQSDYFYQGYTFKQVNDVKMASPYFTVLMYGTDNSMPKAVAMSNAIGDVSFEGVPMDLYTQNKFEVYAGNQLVGVYLPYVFVEAPTFPYGNINTHMQVPSEIDFYTVTNLELPQNGMLLRAFLSGVPNLEMEDDNLFVKGADGSLRFFVNNVNLTGEKITVILDQLPVDYIKSCQLVLYNEPNKYFAGALNITLTVGQVSEFPSDTQYIESIPLSE